MTRDEFLAALVADITDRRGLKHEWNAIDEDVQAEILAKWDGLLGPLLAAERKRCAGAVDELATRARSQKRSAKTKLERESGGVSEYALTVAVTAIRALK